MSNTQRSTLGNSRKYQKLRVWYWDFMEEALRRKSEFRWALRNCPAGETSRYAFWITFDFLSFYFQAFKNFLNGKPITLQVYDHGALNKLKFPLTDVSLFTLYQIFVERMYGIDLPFTPQTIVDLGANLGFASRWLIGKYPNAVVVAVEPEPQNLYYLEENLRGHPKAKIFPGCIYSSNTRVNLMLSNKADSHKIGEGESQEKYLEVEAIDMPELMKKYGLDEIDFLKMDIEGGEKELFLHCDAWIRRVKCIAIEIHPSVFPLSQLQRVMDSNGFKVSLSTKRGMSRIVFCMRE